MNKIKIKNVDSFRKREVPIVEIFGDTLQGEGPRLRPAIFIRTGMCNLKCEGFGCTRVAPDGSVVKGCDTIQAVSPKFKQNWQNCTNFMQIVDQVKPFIHPNPDVRQDIIITGGEPTMHWDTQVFQDTLDYFISRGHHVTVESNGSRKIEFSREYQKKLMFSLSVKLSVSGEPKRKRINIEAIRTILDNTTGSYLKFVTSPETYNEDIKEIREILHELPTHTEVLLMPLGETKEMQVHNTQFVFEKCAQEGFGFSPRIHILAFDTKDGV